MLQFNVDFKLKSNMVYVNFSYYKRRISLEDQEKVLVLSREGYTQLEIAAHLGCTRSCVSEILKTILAGSVKDAKIPGWK